MNSKHIVGINVSALERFDNDTVVTVETLLESGIVKNPRDGVKILGNGELTKKLTVKVNAFSESAKSKIEALGGTARRGKVTEAHGLGRLVGGIFQVGAQHSGNFQRNPGK